MTADQLRTTLQAAPFQPFEIHLADGRAYVVKHPDFAIIGPTGRTMIVYEAEGDDSFNILDLRHVTAIRVPAAPAVARN